MQLSLSLGDSDTTSATRDNASQCVLDTLEARNVRVRDPNEGHRRIRVDGKQDSKRC